MIHEVDRSLAELIKAEVASGGDVDVVFDAPTKDWASRRSAPTINAFLYDIREDVGRRDAVPQPVRNEEGRVIARRPPPRRFRLSYLLTAWTQRPEDEHRLLAQLLTGFLRYDEIPVAFLDGGLAAQDLPVLLFLALPPTQDRSLTDIWTALGGEMKPSLDLAVVAPVDPGRAYEPGPPVREQPRVRLTDDGAEPGARRRGRAAPRTLRPAAVAAPGDPGGEDLQAGTDDAPGRTVHVRRWTPPPPRR
jgi:hypothetical protein